jgi:hypothetical protein
MQPFEELFRTFPSAQTVQSQPIFGKYSAMGELISFIRTVIFKVVTIDPGSLDEKNDGWLKFLNIVGEKLPAENSCGVIRRSEYTSHSPVRRL